MTSFEHLIKLPTCDENNVYLNNSIPTTKINPELVIGQETDSPDERVLGYIIIWLKPVLKATPFYILHNSLIT